MGIIFFFYFDQNIFFYYKRKYPYCTFNYYVTVLFYFFLFWLKVYHQSWNQNIWFLYKYILLISSFLKWVCLHPLSMSQLYVKILRFCILPIGKYWIPLFHCFVSNHENQIKHQSFFWYKKIHNCQKNKIHVECFLWFQGEINSSLLIRNSQ